MYKIQIAFIGLLLSCYACNSNTQPSTAPATSPVDSVATVINTEEEEEDTAFQEVLELPFKK